MERFLSLSSSLSSSSFLSWSSRLPAVAGMMGALVLAAMSAAQAQGAVHAAYRAHLQAASDLQPLGDAPFGETIDLHAGGVAFHQVDTTLHGTGPLIRIARTRPAAGAGASPAAAFGDWILDVPRIETFVAASEGDGSVGAHWRLDATLDAASLARCSRFAAPHAGDAGLARDAWWEGIALHLGDGEAQPLLRRASTWTVHPGGFGESGASVAFPAVTTSHIQLACLPGTRNGETGEGFLAIAPDGTRYWFDWLVGKEADQVASGARVQRRVHAAMFATRVEDRFGNSVDYAYDGPRLTSIRASDGRAVALEWSGARITRITTHPGAEAARTWRYDYAGQALAGVALPDASRWTFDLRTTGGVQAFVPGCALRTSANASTGGAIASTMTAPSGLTGTFVVEPRWHARSQVPSRCEDGRETVAPLVPRWSLVARTWSGPGVDARWEYQYGPAEGSTTRDACAAPGSCAEAQWIDVIDPDGTRVRHVHATAWGALEGKRLRTEVHAAKGALLRTERFVHALPGTAGIARIGDAMRGDTVNGARLESPTPLRERIITQQGRDFAWRVLAFDGFARPLRIERTGTRSRIDVLAYADLLPTWVLGQIATTARIDPDSGQAFETLRIDYDPRTALPLRRHERGLLRETRSWHADGNLASQSDGRDTPAFDTTIRYSGWMRGIPTRIAFPGGVRTSAGVEVDGTIRWVAGETGARTCYAYDAAGRLARITWPNESQPTQCGVESWNETMTAFEQVAAATPLLASFHWTRTERTGNGVRTRWYDALWREVLVEEHDAADIAGTRRSTRRQYDAAGRVAFRSYPSALAVPPLAGTTTRRDALGRIERIERSSELGPLASSFEYLDGFRIRATHPRGHATTMAQLRAYDTPDVFWPEAIAYPEGLFVDIERNAFDDPVRITHRNADASTVATQRAVHDAHGRLCKAIAPNGSAIVFGRDAMDNVTWTAAGTTLDDPHDCQQLAAWHSGRRIDRTWDARNRLATVAYPDGVGNQYRTYTADGLLNRVTTYNAPAAAIVFNTYAWNARRLLSIDALTYPGIDTWRLRTTHDRNGHAAILSYPNGTALGLVPDALGRPTRIGGYALGVRWQPDGAVARFAYGNGIVHTATHNARGLPERRRDAYGATAFHDESLDYDAHGNVAAISDALPGARGDRTLAYDALDRLVEVHSPLFGDATYAHDAIGRPVRTGIGGPFARTHHFCRDAGGALTNIKTLDCANGPSVIGLAHDTAGNLVRMNAQAFSYDFAHRLRAVDGIEAYRYDAHDRRVASDGLRGEGSILSQYALDGRLMWQTDQRARIGKLHVYLGDRLIAIREQALTGGTAFLRYLHTDAQGTPVVETGSDRTLLVQKEYEPFGKRLDRAEVDGVGFAGHVFDGATGLRYTGRDYLHPFLPDALGACMPTEATFASFDAMQLLQAPPPRLRC